MIEIGQEFFFGKDTLGWFIEKSFSFYEMCLDVNYISLPKFLMYLIVVNVTSFIIVYVLDIFQMYLKLSESITFAKEIACLK